MIIDSITGMERYFSLHPRFEKVYKYLRSQSLQELAEGRYEIDGHNAYMTISTSKCREIEDAKLEVHDSYIDIQIPLESCETFGWRDRSNCNDILTPYDETKDIAFFADTAEVFFTLEPLSIAIFFPHDAHAPLIGNGSVKKAVIKVRV